MKRDGRATAAPDSSRLAGAGISEAAVRKATGRGWGDWYGLLDGVGAREMTHPGIVAVVARHQPGSWWQQMIAVAYEQARGLRERHQKDDGFVANASKTIRAGVTRVYSAWADDEIRSGWLDAAGWHIRKATPCKSLRITWMDGHTHLDVCLWPRGEGVTLVQVQHSKLANFEDVARLKTFWGVALERLRELLEVERQPQPLAA
jgi:hypothetical protein